MINARLTNMPWRARIIGVVAKVLGVLVHIEGLPFGSDRNVPRDFTGRVGSKG